MAESWTEQPLLMATPADEAESSPLPSGANLAGPPEPGSEPMSPGLTLSPDISPSMEDGGAAAAAAAGGSVQGGAARAHTPPVQHAGGAVVVEHPMPNVNDLKERPDMIENILKQVPDCGMLAGPAYVLLFDENSDGTLSSGETSTRASGSPAQPLKSIAVLTTAAPGAQGLKCPGGKNPRPQCQWPYGVVIVDCRPKGVGAQHAPYATMQITKENLANEIATWSGQGWTAVNGTGLQKSYYTPKGTDTDYIKKHRCTVFRRKAEDQIYMLLIHEPKGNNIGKEWKKRSAEDELRSMQAKLAKISNDPTASAEAKARAVALHSLNAALEGSLAAGSSSAGPAAAAAASEPEQDTTYRGGGDPAQRALITAECFPTELVEAMQEEDFVSEELSAAIDAARQQLAELEDDLTASKVLVCISKHVADGEGSLAGAEEVDVIRDVFGCRHVDVVSATSADLGAALMGDRSYNIVHFIGHGHAGSQFCLRAEGDSNKHFDMEALCEVLRTHNLEKRRALKLVFFNACHSEEQGMLLRSIDMDDGGIASVMCVAGRIADAQIAVPFSGEFYAELFIQLTIGKSPEADMWPLCVWMACHHACQCILADPARCAVMSAHPMLLAQPEADDPSFVMADWVAAAATSDRGYQRRLVAVAEQKNSIFVLRTGAGKTRIALRMAEIALRRFPAKKIVFNAPTGPLVDQQMKVFAAELRQDASAVGMIRIGGHFGGKNCGDRDANVIFFTPAKLAEYLTKTTAGGLRMENISLLIVDECHHSRGASPLTTVAELYRASDLKPRLLGLTALPVKHDDDEEAAFSHPIGSGAIRCDSSLQGLCDCWMAHLDTVEPGSAEDAEMLRDVPIPDIVPRPLDAPTAQTLKRTLQALRDAGMNPNSDQYEQAEILAKLPLVVGELQHAPGSEFSAILFVHNRTNAHFLLNKLREDYPDLDIQAECVTGHTKTGGMTQAHQKRVLERFRSGSLNLLIATSVAEEGLDIRQVNLVVRLDAAVTSIGFVQSRGRARFPEARYVVACMHASEVEGLIAGEHEVLEKVWELSSTHRELTDLPCKTTWESQPPAAAKVSAAPAGLVHTPEQQGKDPTMELNELCQAAQRSPPRYQEMRLAEQSFQYSVSIQDTTGGRQGAAVLGQPASNKKDAKKSAAAGWLAQHSAGSSAASSVSDPKLELELDLKGADLADCGPEPKPEPEPLLSETSDALVAAAVAQTERSARLLPHGDDMGGGLEERILRVLASTAMPMDALQIARAVGCKFAREVNPTLYQLEQAGQARKSPAAAGTAKPLWE